MHVPGNSTAPRADDGQTRQAGHGNWQNERDWCNCSWQWVRQLRLPACMTAPKSQMAGMHGALLLLQSLPDTACKPSMSQPLWQAADLQTKADLQMQCIASSASIPTSAYLGGLPGQQAGQRVPRQHSISNNGAVAQQQLSRDLQGSSQRAREQQSAGRRCSRGQAGQNGDACYACRAGSAHSHLHWRRLHQHIIVQCGL